MELVLVRWSIYHDMIAVPQDESLILGLRFLSRLNGEFRSNCQGRHLEFVGDTKKGCSSVASVSTDSGERVMHRKCEEEKTPEASS